MNSGKLKLIRITQRELEVFHVMRKHLGDLTILIENGVFEFKNGRIIIHKDNDGKIRQIEKMEISYRA